MDYQKFEKALKHLQSQYDNYLSMDSRTSLTDLDKDGISESVVQRFETCYDMAWKHVKKFLNHEFGLPEVPNSPKPVLRLAYENHIIDDIDNWLKYANARTGTAHDYSMQKFNDALDVTGSFLADAIALYSRMTGKTLSDE
jgi:nucleotidyltransferase substrate binding protein (TIGR01987 family)